ncbi:hypothetical protein [Thermoactinomyces sp. CICC 10522]|uniref:hypothetical protein n=1 Tax=Thermoactinomyces sp. CICC 10522 TaxID=2767427 RepID=UPI0018DE8D53|nr:hypothetical protein [Thermoactinomyces sp. CICC 10522]MBH8605527.1 hypothetical protein [Thermoactinomyces sp. CICC 10522]
MTDRYIHTKEIEEYLYCPKRWKQNKREYIRDENEFKKAIQNRELMREYCNPTLPPEPNYERVIYPKLPIDLPSIVSRIVVFLISFLVVGLFAGPFSTIIFSLVLSVFGPRIVSFVQESVYTYRKRKADDQVRSMRLWYEKEIQRVLWEAEKNKHKLLEEFNNTDAILLAEEYTEAIEKQQNGVQEIINQEYKLFDDELVIELYEDKEKICCVYFDCSHEDIPHYVPIAHKYHLLRLIAQMLIAQNYFPGYKIRGKIQYKNRKPRIFSLEKKFIFALNQVLKSIKQSSDWYIANTYRCVYCPLNQKCKYLREEAREYIERVANK